MKKSSIMALLLVLVFALPGAAEYYRYQDAHGNTIYTDDYSKVPPDQRDRAQSYEESISRPKPESEQDQAAPESSQTLTRTGDEKDRQRLMQQQENLAKEFEALTAERDALDQEKSKAVTRAQIKAHNKKIIDFNARIKAYKEKRDAYTAEVNKFNDRVSSKEPQTNTQ